MVREIYLASRDLKWLRTAVLVVQRELELYWMNRDHLAWGGLSRYHAPSCYPAEHAATITMDHEATWDLSPRFEEHDVLSLLPVDLNCNLYRYEVDMAFFSRELGDRAAEQAWIDRADHRKMQLNSVHWDETDGIYYDFDFQSGKRKHVKSLAAFFPLLYGVALDEQQDRVTSSLPAFEHSFGLATCDEAYGYSDRQWNFPVGWPPLHLLAFRALLRSGKEEAAVRVASKWLTLNLDVWIKTRRFFEKYDVVAGTHEVLTDRYRNQEGFGWTNAVFHLLVEDLREVGAV